ncbi:L,D-transpeptidase [Bdellovibrio bacteriovorus]|uniref:L,D-transpeptidase n=1 Tax=Bdellovibrio bacteriovorus TaxID=959 RepID=UPI0035A72372
MKNVMKYGVVAAALVVSQSASASFWGKVKNAFNDCKYEDQEYSQVYSYEKAITPRLPEYLRQQQAFSEQDFYSKPWLRDFRYVIVINKAEQGRTAQTMRVYEYGRVIINSKVSTGREGLELKRKNKECTGAPAKSYWSQTPTGYYTPKFLSKDHHSSSWDSSMPFAIFYDVDNGLALHEVYKKYTDYLGGRASGGCTRQDAKTAEELFNRVKETERATIPEINPDGTPVLNEDGSVKYINSQYWTSQKTGETVKFNTFSALIIVQDVRD